MRGVRPGHLDSSPPPHQVFVWGVVVSSTQGYSSYQGPLTQLLVSASESVPTLANKPKGSNGC